MFTETNLPYRHLVPRDRLANVRFRKDLVERAANSQSLREDLLRMSARDPLFWLNAFCCVFEPRYLETPFAVPISTYRFQERLTLDIVNALGNHDLRIRKSRATCVTWTALMAFAWRWRFFESSSFMVVSLKAAMADSAGNPDALLQKWDWLFSPRNMPGWMIPQIDSKLFHRANRDNGSVVDGESCVGDAGRGGRRLADLLDEFASFTQDTEVLDATGANTRCRIIASTPKGIGTAFARLDESQMPTVRIHWTDHPVYKRGLYKVTDGQLEILDPTPFVAGLTDREEGIREYRFPEDYPFVKDGPYFINGRPRSPWYDNECARGQTPMGIRQEYEMEDALSENVFFDPELLDRHDKAYGRPALWRGDLMRKPGPDRRPVLPPHLEKRSDGCLRLWVQPGPGDRFPADRAYGIGCDIGEGARATPSVATIGDLKTHEVVGVYASAKEGPSDFAYVVSALTMLFGGNHPGDPPRAELNWEVNGPGVEFGMKIWEIGARRMWRRRKLSKPRQKITDEFGVISGGGGDKTDLLRPLRAGMVDDQVIIHDRDTLQECRNYANDGGCVVNRKLVGILESAKTSGARESHGDLVIGLACLWLIMRNLGPAKVGPETQEIPRNCVAARHLAVKREDRNRRDDGLFEEASGELQEAISGRKWW